MYEIRGLPTLSRGAPSELGGELTGTEAFDRSEKFEGYRSIETLRDYVMLASADAHAEHYARGSDGGWTLREYGVGGAFSLSSVEVALRVDELYEGAFNVTDAG